LQAVIAIGRIGEPPLLVDDAQSGFLGGKHNLADVREPVFDIGMQFNRGLGCGLRVKLTRIGHLEEDVLDHIGGKRAGETQGLSPQQGRVKAVAGGAQGMRIARFARERQQGQANPARRGIARGPGFTRAGIRRMTVGAQVSPIQ